MTYNEFKETILEKYNKGKIAVKIFNSFAKKKELLVINIKGSSYKIILSQVLYKVIPYNDMY